jgi:hypothetical protein
MNSNAALTMNSETEELLLRYLDHTLSADDQGRFDALLRENPVFADEVRSITSFDDLLESAHSETQWLHQVDTAFLSEMQQQMAQTLLLGTAAASVTASAASTSAAGSSSALHTVAITTSAATAGKTGAAVGTGKAATILTSAFVAKSLVVAAVCGSIGYGVWQYTTSGGASSTTPLPASPSAQRTQQTVTPPSAPPEKTATQPSVKPEVTSSAHSEQSAAPSVRNATTPDKVQNANTETTRIEDAQDTKASANIESNTAQQLRAKIEQLTLQVRLEEQNGNKLGVADAAKKLGMLERTAGKLSESGEFLDKALKAAQSLKLRELEGEIRAELALLYHEQGNGEKALSTLREAVKILTDEGSPKVGKWSKELNRWERR